MRLLKLAIAAAVGVTVIMVFMRWRRPRRAQPGDASRRAERSSSVRVTRDVDAVAADDLLRRVPRACIGFAGDDGPVAEPALVRAGGDVDLVGVSEFATRSPRPGDEVVLLVDEGLQYFDLRAIYVRGDLVAAEPPDDARHAVWFGLRPKKTKAWDYGTMRLEQIRA